MDAADFTRQKAAAKTADPDVHGGCAAVNRGAD